MAHATLTTPSYLVGQLPPPLPDAVWLPRGSTPLGASALGASVSNVDEALTALLVDLGFVVTGWSFP